MTIPKRIIEKAARAVSPHLFTDVFEQTLNKLSLFTPEQARESTEKKRAEALQSVTDVLTPVYADIQAEALREAASAFQVGGWAKSMPRGNDRPTLILGMAQHAINWFRARADELDGGA